ncbi:MAG: bifunctional pyr operon transcriptional regulator/uracil phosphoribosyltransferase PyrR [Rhodothermales bacterium]
MARTLILPAQRVRRTIERLACEVIEHNRGIDNLIILGVRSGGTALADALAAQIRFVTAASGKEVPVEHLDISGFRDDRARVTPAPLPASRQTLLDDKDVVLVDDVLFTGRTSRAALDAIVQMGRPRSIQLLVLVDRGHREYPIQANFVGRVIQTKHKEQVVVDVEEGFAIYVEE